ncbi:MAG TPA: PAS domain S-box protein [Nannocystis sp.]|jgi:rsbT co-antagonist protein RsbR
MSSTFERLFMLSTAMMATIDPQGRFVALNPAWEKTLGWTLDELRALTPIELIHPDDRPAALAAAERMTRGRPVQLENRCRCQDGSYKWLMWSCSVDDALPPDERVWYASAVDISAHRETVRHNEQALARLRLFEAMLENTPDQVGIIDVQGRVLYRNASARRIVHAWGHPEGSTKITVKHSPAFTERLEREIRPILRAGGTWSGEGDLLLEDGSVMPIYQVLVTLRDVDGAIVGWGSLIRDISDVKQIEQRLRAAVQDLATPLIPISDRVLVMPLIGQIDVERASQVTRAALDGVHGRGVEVVLIDVTGLQQIDAEVAKLLLATTRALALLGVRTVLTGIQPTVARTWIDLGLDLSGIETASTLQSAIAGALARRHSRPTAR